MDVIYFVKEGNTARRIDSMMVKPLRDAGYTIMRMALDGKNEVTELKPDEEMPDGFLQESKYGMVMIMRTEEETKTEEDSKKTQNETNELKEEIEALKKEIEELKKGGNE